MKQKILFLSRTLGKTGVPVFLRSVLNEIDADGFDITVGLEFDNDITQLKFLNDRVSVVFYNSQQYKTKFCKFIERVNCKALAHKMLIPLWKLTNQILKICERKRIKNLFNCKYDYAVAFHQGKASKYLKYDIKSSRKYYFYHASYLMKDCREKYFLKADKMIFVSDGAMDRVLSKWKKIDRNRCEVISPLIDIESIRQQSKEKKSFVYRDGCIKLLTVGRLVADKGYDLLIKTAVILNTKKVNYQWLVIGDGPLYDCLKDDINNHGLNENVKLLGSTENPYPYFSECDFYVSTSKYEPFGIVMLEASIFGKTFLATNTDGAVQQIHNGQSGFLVKFDETELSNLIIQCADDVQNNNNLNKIVFEYDKYKNLIHSKIMSLFQANSLLKGN